MKIRRAIIYVRVSKDPHKRFKSVTAQEALARNVCEQNDWPVGMVLSDNDRSATRFARKQREGFAQLAEVVQSGDVVVIRDSDRAQRDLKVYVELRELLAGRGAYLHYNGQTFDLADGDDRFRTGLDALLAENEGEKIAKRIAAGHARNLEAGRPHGKLPWGYERVRDPKSGEPIARVPHPVQAPIFRELVRRFLDGESLAALTRWMNESPGARKASGARWQQPHLSRMLKSPTYAGYRVHKNAIAREGTWEALISMADHNAVCAILNDPNRVTHRGTAPKYLLSRIAICGVCKLPVVRRTEPYDAYVCEFGHIGRSRRKVDLYVTELLLKLAQDADALAEVFAPIEDDAPALGGPTIVELEARLDEYAIAASRGDISTRMLGRIEADIEAQISEIRARATSRVMPPAVARLANAGDIRAEWDAMDIAAKRDAVRSTVAVTINRVGHRAHGIGVDVEAKKYGSP